MMAAAIPEGDDEGGLHMQLARRRWRKLAIGTLKPAGDEKVRFTRRIDAAPASE